MASHFCFTASTGPKQRQSSRMKKTWRYLQEKKSKWDQGIKWNYFDLVQSQDKQFVALEAICSLINLLKFLIVQKIQLGGQQFWEPVPPVALFLFPISRHGFGASRQRSGSFRNSWDAKRKHVPDVCTAHSTTSCHTTRRAPSTSKGVARENCWFPKIPAGTYRSRM